MVASSYKVELESMLLSILSVALMGTYPGAGLLGLGSRQQQINKKFSADMFGLAWPMLGLQGQK